MSHNIIPRIGLGTFEQSESEAFQSSLDGLEVGYRHIDTAQIYGNESAVGRAVVESKVKKEDIFITTKIWIDNFSTNKFIPSLQESLDKLQMDQVDLTLIHWPNKDVPLALYLELLSKAKQQGLTKYIGVSNFNIELLEESFKILGKDAISTNQIEIHPYLQNNKLVEFCRLQGIHVTAYMPLARGKVVNDAVIMQIAKKYNTTPVNITLAWLLAEGFTVIPSSKKRDNLKSNLNALNISLDKADIDAIKKLNINERIVSPDFSPKWD